MDSLKSSETVLATVMIIIVIGCSQAAGQRGRTIKPAEQTSFGSEAPVLRPAMLPQDVLNRLARYDGGRLKKCQMDEFREKNPADHFVASRISLNGDRLPDLLVQGRTICFMGAHNTTFWLFAQDTKRAGRYTLVFDIHADGLALGRRRTNTFRDFEAMSHSAVQLFTSQYRFDGKKYVEYRCTVEEMGSNRPRRRPC